MKILVFTKRFMLKKIFYILSLIILGFTSNLHAGEEWHSSFPQQHIDIDKKIISALAGKFDAELVGKKVPFARRLMQLKNGEIDILAGLLKDESRETFAYFLNTPYKNKTNKVFIMRVGEGKHLESYDDLHNLRVGVQIGSKYFPRFDTDSEITKVASVKDENRLQMLLFKRFDALIHTDVYAADLVYRNGLEDKVEFAPFKYTKHNPVYIAVSKKSPLYDRREELEAALSEMLDSGEIDQIIQSYFLGKGLPVPEYN